MRFFLSGTSTRARQAFSPPLDGFTVANDATLTDLTVEINGTPITLEPGDVYNSRKGEGADSFRVAAASGAWRFIGFTARSSDVPFGFETPSGGPSQVGSFLGSLTGGFR